MKFTFIDKDFQKHSSFEISLKEIENLPLQRKKEIVIQIFNKAISALEEENISRENIRVIDWENQKLYHLKDFNFSEVLNEAFGLSKINRMETS